MTPIGLNGFPFTVLTDLSCPFCYIYSSYILAEPELPYVPITKFLERGQSFGYQLPKLYIPFQTDFL